MEEEGKEGPHPLPTPELSHLTEADYELVYEPSEDTFLFLDALQLDATFLRARQRSFLCLEVGCVGARGPQTHTLSMRALCRAGSGCVVCFLAKEVLRGLPASFFATDINEHAAAATMATGRANNARVPSPSGSTPKGGTASLMDHLIFSPHFVTTPLAPGGSGLCARRSGVWA